jgi:CDP-diacylglycerol--serine O-phosphatidyltransferase
MMSSNFFNQYIKKHIPNAITCGNLLAGCLGIHFCYQSNLTGAASMIFLAATFDFADGFVARLLKVSSPIGKELDSLADVVSFGLLPGFIVFHLINKASIIDNNYAFIAFIIPVFSALRLAKFNIDTRQTDSFIGLPTPANAIFFAGFPFIIENDTIGWGNILLQTNLLILLAITMSVLLVIELPLFALKFKNYIFAENKLKYIFLGLSLLILLAGSFVAIPIIIVLYIALSVIDNLLSKRTSS